MAKLTQKKPYHRRGKRTQLKHKQHGGLGIPSALRRTDSAAMSAKSGWHGLGKAGWTRSKARRLTGRTGYIDKAGDVAIRTRSQRGKRALSRKLTRRDRTTSSLAAYKKHRWARVEAMEAQVNRAEMKLTANIQKIATENQAKLELTKTQLGKVPFKKIKPTKMQDEIEAAGKTLTGNDMTKWDACRAGGDCDGILKKLLTQQKKTYSTNLLTKQTNSMKPIKEAKARLELKVAAYKKMERKTDVALVSKRATAAQAVNKGVQKKCAQLAMLHSEINGSECIKDFAQLRLANPKMKLHQLSAKMQESTGIYGSKYTDKFSLTSADIEKSTKKWHTRSSITRKRAKRHDILTDAEVADADAKKFFTSADAGTPSQYQATLDRGAPHADQTGINALTTLPQVAS